MELKPSKPDQNSVRKLWDDHCFHINRRTADYFGGPFVIEVKG
ncbi:hypothetical protein J21TS7_29620 [Paenibacillus cineris]|uniref:Uncharacterized protein n=1 Tax=Paenibacillus cineris TaxID=237530 RepID=A0ABQ4LDL0_9BACL|nr:hypothetical protein J21TS7_29620 [Paenibacillus cineris]